MYGDISSVEVDDVEGNISETSKAPEKYSVCVMYITRHAAETTFTHGRSSRRHNLQLDPNNTLNHFSVDVAALQLYKGFCNGEIKVKKDSYTRIASAEKDSSSKVFQIETETYVEKNVVFNCGSNIDNVVESFMEGVGMISQI